MSVILAATQPVNYAIGGGLTAVVLVAVRVVWGVMKVFISPVEDRVALLERRLRHRELQIELLIRLCRVHHIDVPEAMFRDPDEDGR